MSNYRIAKCLNITERPPVRTKERINTVKYSEEKQKWWIKKYFRNDVTNYGDYLNCLRVNKKVVSESLRAPLSEKNISKELYRVHNGPKVMGITKTWTSKTLTQKGVMGHEWLCQNLTNTVLFEVSEAIDKNQKKGFNINKESVLNNIYDLINRKLYELIMPSLILEANILRIKSSKSSSSPEERFRDFVVGLGVKKNSDAFWGKYPVLWKRAAISAIHCKRSCVETIDRLAKDIKLVQTEFGLQKSERLESINWGAGDSHCGGRTVAVLKFKNELIVYKPKSLAIDVAYFEFIKWISKSTNAFDLKTLKVLNLDTHGYCEFVEAKKCENQTQLNKYYKNLGALTAIFWFLGGTDLHHENLIASASQPFPVDLETLFERSVRRRLNQKYLTLHSKAFENLLLKTYLLPFREKSKEGIKDVSAMGAKGEQPANVDIRQIDNFARDDLRVVVKPGFFPQENNVPFKSDDGHDLTEFVDCILEGYELAFDAIYKARLKLTDKNSILRRFNNIKVRWIGRRTLDYVNIIGNMSHPNVLQDALECDMMIGTLWQNKRYEYGLNQLVPYEYQDIWQGDVPYFSTKTNSKDLVDARGNRIRNFFQETGFEALLGRLDDMSYCKLAQLQSLKNAIQSTKSYAVKKDADYHFSGKLVDENDLQKRLVIHASEIGTELYRTAYFVEDIPFWSSLDLLDEKNCTANVLKPTLYEGTPGIGLFFTYLYSINKKQEYLKIAQGAHKLVKVLLKSPDQFSNPGAFSGLGGIIYCDMILSKILCTPSSVTKETFLIMDKLISEDNQYDIIYGSAGALLTALRHYQHTQNFYPLHTAKLAAEKLYKHQVPQKNGTAWPNIYMNKETYFGGLAHGVSGVAWALSEYYQLTKRLKWKQLAQKAFDYEADQFDKKVGAWKDVRNDDIYASAWCHGSVGIGLCASQAKGVVSKLEKDRIMRRAYDFTARSGYHSHCLCHGSLGNSDLFLKQNSDFAKTIASDAVRDFESRGKWLCGMPGEMQTPGLLCGLAGIGYGLLRNAYPDKIPSVLLLETE